MRRPRRFRARLMPACRSPRPSPGHRLIASKLLTSAGVRPLSDLYPEVLPLSQGIKGHLVVPNLSKVAYMIYDASTPALPREGCCVQQTFFTDERVARDLVFESRPVRFPRSRRAARLRNRVKLVCFKIRDSTRKASLHHEDKASTPRSQSPSRPLIDPLSALCYDRLRVRLWCVEGALTLLLCSTALRKDTGTR